MIPKSGADAKIGRFNSGADAHSTIAIEINQTNRTAFKSNPTTMTLTDDTDLTKPSFVVDLNTDEDFRSSPSESVSLINPPSPSSTSQPSPPKQLTIEDGKVVTFNFDDLDGVSAQELFQVRMKSIIEFMFAIHVLTIY